MTAPVPPPSSHPRLFRHRWLWLFIPLALAALTVAALSWRRGQTEAPLIPIRAALEAGRYGQAQPLLESYLRENPSSPEAHFLQAQLAFALGNPALVEAHLTRARTLGYPPREVDRLYGFLLVRSRRYPEAEFVLAPLFAEMRSPDVQLEEALARCYLQTYKLDEASRVLKRWMADAPRDARPFLWHTEIDKRGDVDPNIAIGHYREALARDPSLDQARLGIAETLRAAHRNDEADQEFQAYLQIKPEDVTALIGAGSNRSEAGDLSQAAAYLDRALAIEPANPTALRERSRVALARDGAAAALPFLDRAIAADPYETETYNRRALVLTQLGRTADAAADRKRRDQLRADLEVLRNVRKRLEVTPADNRLRAQVAAWMFDHGQPEAGQEWAKLILTDAPNHPEANRLLADYHEKRGEAGLANFYRLRVNPSPTP